MDLSRLPEPLRARAEELTARPPIDKVRDLLRSHVEPAEDLDEVGRSFRSAARNNIFFLKQNLAALEEILSSPQEPGTLLRLVEWDANWAIDHDQTDSGAGRFLSEIAQMLREAIEQQDR
ncbi:hypothetical protein AB0G04_39005 [Actinoplanes sp. NPDC023801]|uniref:hypothetical protein n=1 Tax=Actinoplanes sp. NPDC023801 TaxID=3154595 RepID=UPI0033C4FC63